MRFYEINFLIFFLLKEPNAGAEFSNCHKPCVTLINVNI